MKKLFLILASLFVGISLVSFTASADSNDDDAPDITTKYDINNMDQYSDDDLGEYVTINKFYVKAVSYDKHHKKRIIFTNTPQSDTYFFTVLNGNKHNKKIKVGKKVTIKGTVFSKQSIEKTQANRGFGSNFYGKQAFFVLTDSYK